MNVDIIRKVRKIVKIGNKEKIKTTLDFTEDSIHHKFSKELIDECLLCGFHCTKDELYPNPERYTSPFYALYYTIFHGILVGYDLNKDVLILIHTSPLGNWEKNQYNKFKKKL